MKKLITAIAVMTMSMLMATTAFAGEWKTGAARPDAWWYDNGDGTYAKNGWHWIDGNNDGTAESYYFDGEGWMLANTTTPDGYQVDGNGAWVQNGIVQTKKIGTQAGSNNGSSTENHAAGSNSAQSGARFSRGTYGYDETTRTSIGCKWMKEDGTYAQNEWVDVGNMQLWFWNDQYARPTEGSMRNSDGSWDFTKTNANTNVNTSTNTNTSSDDEKEYTSEVEEVDVDAYIDEFIELTNKERRKAGVPELTVSDDLMEYAAIRAEEISGDFSHFRSNGKLAGFENYLDLGYTTTIGENICSGYMTPQQAIKQIMNSSGHKKAMLKANRTDLGVGIYVDDNNKIYYVQEFGGGNG